MIKYNRHGGYPAHKPFKLLRNDGVFKNSWLEMVWPMLDDDLYAKAHKFMRFNFINTSRAWEAYLRSLPPLPPQLTLPATNFIRH